MSMNETILHPAAIAQVMVNFASKYGIDQQTCLQGTGIAEEELRHNETLITRQQEMRLIENLILALPDEAALGFKLGLQYNVSTFGIWGFALRTSRTLRDAAGRAMKYLPLSTAYCKMYEFEENSFFGIGMDPDNIPAHLRQFLLERDIATGFNLMKELSLAGLSVAAMTFKETPPAYAKEISTLIGIEPLYNAPQNALMIQLEDVDTPLPTYDANLVKMLEHQCKMQLEHRQVSGLAGQVRQQLLGPLGLIATLDEVANALAMSPRSLRRKLDQEGIKFRSIVEDERRQIALQLLEGSNMKLEELAIHLGYTDTASFTRAFRRWMGCSPGEYRKQSQ